MTIDPAEVEDRKDKEEKFKSELSKFESLLDLALKISNCVGVKEVSLSEGWTSWIFTRLCMMAVSAQRIVDHKWEHNGQLYHTLDHGTLASLARSMLETCVMLGYVADQDVAETEWDLRRDILWLHDATTRYKMFKFWGTPRALLKQRPIFLRSENEL